jgi:uncharacterized protein (TIGR01777 family)
MTTFTRQSLYPCSAAELYAWHGRAGALERLLPPWENATVLARTGGIEPGGQVLLKMRRGPLSFSFQARHQDNIAGRMFQDVQEKGPFAHWSHRHYFEDLPGGGCRLSDVVEYALPGDKFLPGWIKASVTQRLEQLFHYRETVLKEDILLHQRCHSRPLRLLISGASGVLGRSLVPLLTTGGHHVSILVRRRPDPAKGEIFWDPERGILNGADLPDLDGVIHLAGEYIGLARWRDEKKRRVIDSRVKGTELLAKTLAASARPPAVLLSASAVGYYGDRGDDRVDEGQPPGQGFISEVCRRWEQAVKPAADAGIRTVCLRLGIGLSPRGGALKRILAASPCGCIRRFGTGRQLISWISDDDMTSAILHALTCSSLAGPVNIAAPHPVSNGEFMRTLTEITGRPLLWPLPARLLKIVYGQMASEILLSSCGVATGKLTASGFIFRHPTLDQALRRLLGKERPRAPRKDMGEQP